MRCAVSLRAEALIVDDLWVTFDGGARPVVRSVSFTIQPGQAMGLVGESGSGKTLTARSILRLLPPGAAVRGSVRFGDRSLLTLGTNEMRRLRGSRIAMIFQDPNASLNPLLRVGNAIAQVIQAHESTDRRSARRKAIDSLERVGIRDAARRANDYPHQFSGGMRQRVLIAMALAGRPQLLLADEPTTALDVIVQAGILDLLDSLRREEGMSLLLVSHDLAVVAGMCERVGVMYAGELVEEGAAADVLFQPRHPYTRALLDSVPHGGAKETLRGIPGSPPEPGRLPPGCAFAPRCPLATIECEAGPIPFVEVGPEHRSRCIHADRVAAMSAEGGSGASREPAAAREGHGHARRAGTRLPVLAGVVAVGVMDEHRTDMVSP
jgi:oligopeptide/dipeptide ABC transporter ATP-binding protein